MENPNAFNELVNICRDQFRQNKVFRLPTTIILVVTIEIYINSKNAKLRHFPMFFRPKESASNSKLNFRS